MKQEINEQDLEQVVGGTVYVNGTKMKISLTVLGKAYKLKNCEDYQVMGLVSQLYGQYKTKGDLAYETAVRDALSANGWI